MTAKKQMAVFAHNEAQNILLCLESIKRASTVMPVECFVLANGCTDQTSELVGAYSQANRFVKLVQIDTGDKANAWNEYVYKISNADGTNFFVDGDVEISEDSLALLEKQLEQHPLANAAAAVPANCGRTARSLRTVLVQEGGFAGNLYALSGIFLQTIRKTQLRLPVGLIGDDSLIAALARWNLDPHKGWDMTRIIVCERAEFKYRSLSVLSPDDLIAQYNRKIRYSLRHFQNQMLRQLLKSKGIGAVPRSVEELYKAYAYGLKISWRGLDTLFDWIALRKILKSC